MARTVARVNAEGELVLQRIRVAQEARERAEAEYREALLAGEAAGLTNTAMAKAVGKTPESVRQVIIRNS